MSLATRRPVPADFASILAINSAAVPNVASPNESELKRLIGVGDLVLVAEDAGRIVGYLIGMLDTARYDGEEFQHFTRLAADSFLYIDQIAVLMHARHQGVGSHLYADAIRWSVERGIARLCCEVNLQPENPSSLSFHRKHGFDDVGRLKTADGRLVALLSKEV
jgi:uncharacterized protein